MSQSMQVDRIIKARWVLPIVPTGKIYENCSVAINKGDILAIAPNDEIAKLYHSKHTTDLPNHVLMPGFVNAHGHAAMSLMRGYADDLPLSTWLNDHIWPTEAKWVDAKFVQDGTQLAMAEMISTGTTCFSDMYFFPEEAARAAHNAGLRAQIVFPVLEFPSAWAANADEYIHKGLALHDHFSAQDLISVGFGPHAPYTVSNESLTRISVLAEELQAPVQIHLHETADEVKTSLEKTGMRPIERLRELNVLTPLTQCVHMTQITDSDVALLQDVGASVIHCPNSNLKLASGICPTQKLLDANITVALGTDSAASNNGLNLLTEANTAALIGKFTASNAAAINAHTALNMATIMGAKALGLDKLIGSLEAGKQADLTAIALDGLGSMPLYDVASHLVYNPYNTRVTHTWVRGRCLFQDGVLTTLSPSEIKLNVTRWQYKLGRRNTQASP